MNQGMSAAAVLDAIMARINGGWTDGNIVAILLPGNFCGEECNARAVDIRSVCALVSCWC
jgi:hypothetical protein